MLAHDGSRVQRACVYKNPGAGVIGCDVLSEVLRFQGEANVGTRRLILVDNKWTRAVHDINDDQMSVKVKGRYRSILM